MMERVLTCRLVLCGVAALLVASCGHSSNDKESRKSTVKNNAVTSGDAATNKTIPPTRKKPRMSNSDSIGQATMKPDGTIVLQLRAETNGAVGDAQFEYPRGHNQYEEILKHLGGLKPGEQKPVPPWD